MTLGDEKYILFTTYRKNGEAVSSPVWSVPVDDGTIGFWTSSGSGRACAYPPRVEVQACDDRGKVKPGSESVEGTAELVTGGRLDEITQKVKRSRA